MRSEVTSVQEHIEGQPVHRSRGLNCWVTETNESWTPLVPLTGFSRFEVSATTSNACVVDEGFK
jgi:hypothetical protein